MVLPLSQPDVQSQLSAWPAWVDTRKGLYREKQRFHGVASMYWALQLAGRTWRPGVAAMPGNSFGRKRGGTWMVRHEMDEWLRLNGMTGVVVAYDNEQKGDPSLPGYNDDVDDRFDAVTWGLVLARDLGRSRRAWFGMLPEVAQGLFRDVERAQSDEGTKEFEVGAGIRRTVHHRQFEAG